MPYVTTPERYGREEGLKQGLKEGLEKGRAEAAMLGIEVALKVKFGQSGLALLPEIRTIEDSRRLETILRSIDSAASLDELRRIRAE